MANPLKNTDMYIEESLQNLWRSAEVAAEIATEILPRIKDRVKEVKSCINYGKIDDTDLGYAISLTEDTANDISDLNTFVKFMQSYNKYFQKFLYRVEQL